MRLRILSYLSFLIILVTSSVQAAVIPGRWEKVESLPPGSELEVRLNSKERLKGRLLAVEDEEIVLGREKGDELRLQKSQIVKVRSRDRIERDSVNNGLLWGTIVGATVGVPWLIWGLSYQGGESDDAKTIGTGICLMSVGVGAGVGLAADAVRKGQEVYFVAAGN